MAGYTPVGDSAKLPIPEIMKFTVTAVGITAMVIFAWLLGTPVPPWMYYTYISIYLIVMFTQVLAYGLDLP